MERLQKNSQRYFLNKKETLEQLDAVLKRLHPEQTIQLVERSIDNKTKEFESCNDSYL